MNKFQNIRSLLTQLHLQEMVIGLQIMLQKIFDIATQNIDLEIIHFKNSLPYEYDDSQNYNLQNIANTKTSFSRNITFLNSFRK